MLRFPNVSLDKNHSCSCLLVRAAAAIGWPTGLKGHGSRCRRHGATALSPASRGPAAPLPVSGRAHGAGHSGSASGPCWAQPFSPRPASFPPPPPPRGSVIDTSVARLPPRAYGAVRRPAQARCRASWVPHPGLLGLREGSDAAGSACPSPERGRRYGLPRVRSVSAAKTGPMSGRDALPAPAPVNASLTPLLGPAQAARPAWVASPLLSQTCTPAHRAGLSRHIPTPGMSCALERVGSRRLIGRLSCLP
jgi:hypothetical protein